MRRRPRLLGGMVIAVGALALPGSLLARTSTDVAEVRAQLADVRLPFITNQGQVDARVAYYARTFAGTVFVTQQGQLVYALNGPRTDAKRDGGRPSPSSPGWSLTETLLGGRARPVAQDRSTSGVSTFMGHDPAHWRAALPTWEQVGLGEAWPGITVTLRARGRSVEKVFTVSPGSSVARIRVRVKGAHALEVDGHGALVARTGLGAVTFTAPVAYQERDGVRRPVAVAYRHRGSEYGFSVGAYDPGLPLVIDPLLQSTYLGGGGADEQARAVAIHPTTGDVYVAGQTNSNPFPGTTGGAQPAFGGGSRDAFVARFPSTLTSLTQATYLGGSGSDSARALAIHPTTGDVYVAGQTDSSPFPGTAGGAQPAIGGFTDAFVARFPSTLTSLTQATYLGGSGNDTASSISIRATTGDVYVAGEVQSFNFPGTAGGAQPASGGGLSDAFVARFPSTLTSLTQATYLGGGGTDTAFALTIHPMTGDVYVAGTTGSSPFPGTAGGAQPAFGGAFDAFVARFPSTLTALTQATYLGGSALEVVTAIAIHPTSGDIYVAGDTSSNPFPGTGGGAQPAFGGSTDAIVARFPSTLTALTQATYLGGSGTETAFALSIHATTGDVYVAGQTNSNPFPGATGGAQPAFGGGSFDGFVARFSSTLTALTQATYLGGSGSDSAFALAIHPTSGDVYVAGSTASSPFPGTAVGAQPAISGFNDAFVARLTSDLAGPFAATIPTLSGWALLTMVALLLVTGLLILRRHRWAQ